VSETPQPKLIHFNINGYARLRLSAGSLRRWREKAERTRAAYPDVLDRDEIWPLEPPVDADGRWRAQLWEIMAVIGPDCFLGGQPTEDGDLVMEIPADDE